MKLTELEAQVLGNIIRKEDPWLYQKHRGTRLVSQAVQRLQRKGAITGFDYGRRILQATAEGLDA